PIVSHHPLVVSAGRVTFVAPVGGEVEHVPDGLLPHERPSLHRNPIRLVKEILIFLGVPKSAGIRRRWRVLVLRNGRAGAVLGESQRTSWNTCVGRVDPSGDLVVRTAIPA